MPDTSNGSTINLNESRIQALVSSLAPNDSAAEKKLSEEQIEALSNRLNHLLGNVEEGPEVRRNRKGEVLNEEGLPMIDISEPLSDTSHAAQSLEVFASAHDPPPLSTLSEQERTQLQIRRDRILDVLEEEEHRESERELEREQKRCMEEVARMDAETKAAAREMQKKMGKALLKNLAAQREKEEQERKDAQETASAAVPRLNGDACTRKPKKSVSFANVPEVDEEKPKPPVVWGDVSVAKLKPGVPKARLKTEVLGGQPMKLQVVERIPGVEQKPHEEHDSDDESNPDAQDIDANEDTEEEDNPWLDDDSGGEAPVKRSEDSEEDEFDLSQANIQREVALEYIRLREKVGAEVRQAMTSHNYEPEDEWDQSKVPLEASLASKPPRAGVSRFKSERQAGLLASSDTSISLGSSILSERTSSNLQKAVRTGKLVNGQLVSGDESDIDLEEGEKEIVKLMMEALTNGVSPDNGSEPLVPTTTRDNAGKVFERGPSFTFSTPQASQAPPQGTSSGKASRFKSERTSQREQTGSTTAASHSCVSTTSPLSGTVLERSSSARSIPSDFADSGRSVNNRPRPNAAFKMPPTVIQTPAIPPAALRPFEIPQVPPDPAILNNMIVDSPSFPPPNVSARPDLAPLPLVSEVRESTRRAGTSEELNQRTGRISRFKAERTHGVI